MGELSEHIIRIQNKLQQLLRQYDLVQKEYEKSTLLISSLKTEQEQGKAQMAELHQQNLILKASLQSLEPAEKKELEQKLSQYIKNIDKSISLLSQ